jgi:hypothetical protein
VESSYNGIPLCGASTDRGYLFGPDAESIDGKRTLAQQIQVASDLAALCKVVSAVPSQKAIQLEQRGHGRMHCHFLRRACPHGQPLQPVMVFGEREMLVLGSRRWD